MEKDEGRSAKTYDLEERTMEFARQCRLLASALKRDIVSYEDIKQLMRSSGSVAANYAESRESLSRKDCLHRLKICKKEAKESFVWLNLLRVQKNPPLATELERLARESTELTLIFGAIIAKLKDS
jgi:four helix bundle protein